MKLDNGVRSGMAYVNAGTLSELRECEMVEISPAGQTESLPHGKHQTGEGKTPRSATIRESGKITNPDLDDMHWYLNKKEHKAHKIFDFDKADFSISYRVLRDYEFIRFNGTK